jgi:hypothetical protein
MNCDGKSAGMMCCWWRRLFGWKTRRNSVSLFWIPGQVIWLELKLIYDRQSVGQSVLVSGTHLGPATNFSFSLKFSSHSCGFCYFVVPPLTRGWVCSLLYNYFWALPEHSLLGRSLAELTAIFCCLIWDSANLEGQVPVFISPGTGWPSYTLGHRGTFPPGNFVPFASSHFRNCSTFSNHSSFDAMLSRTDRAVKERDLK